MRNPLTMHRQGRGPVFQFYRSQNTKSGWMFSHAGSPGEPVGWLLSGGIRGRNVAIGWYRW